MLTTPRCGAIRVEVVDLCRVSLRSSREQCAVRATYIHDETGGM